MAGDGSQDATRPRRVGIVVVHGVGETEPGYSINALFDTLSKHHPSYRMSHSSEHERIEELDSHDIGVPAAAETKNADTETAARAKRPTFPVFRRHGTHESGIEISGAEVFWADTTSLQGGRVNTLLGLFRVIFESHHIVHAMLKRRKDWVAWLVRQVLLLAAWLLRGPIAALTIATSAICTVLLFEPALLKFADDNAHWKFLAVQGLLFALSIVLLIRIVQFKDYTWYDVVVALGVVSFALFVLDAFDILLPLLDEVPSLKTGTSNVPLNVYEPACDSTVLMTVKDQLDTCYISGLYKVIIWGWRGWGWLMLFCIFALLAFAMMRARKTSEKASLSAIATSIGILGLQFVLWVTVVVSVLYPMLNRAETNAALSLLFENPNVMKFAQTLVKPTNTVAQLLDYTDIHPDWIIRFKFIYVAAASTGLILVVASMILMQVRRRRASAGLSGLTGAALTTQLERNSRRMPRLLFNRILIGILIAAILAVLGLVYFQSVLESDERFVSFRNIFLPIAAVIALVVPMFFGPRITNVVHIARDLIDHHYRRRWDEFIIAGIPKVDRSAPRRVWNHTARPRRDRISARLVALLDRYVRHAGFDDVIFVAHSQGSIVAYDYLRDYGPDYPELGGAKPALLTSGSPLGTIYQRYFEEYSPQIPVPDSMAATLKRWVNLYRVDDYIGGRIKEPGGLAISNIVMTPGAHRHTNYWIEKRHADVLDDLIQGRSVAVPVPDPPDLQSLTPPPLPATTTQASHPASPSWVHAMRGA